MIPVQESPVAVRPVTNGAAETTFMVTDLQATAPAEGVITPRRRSNTVATAAKAVAAKTIPVPATVVPVMAGARAATSTAITMGAAPSLAATRGVRILPALNIAVVPVMAATALIERGPLQWQQS